MNDVLVAFFALIKSAFIVLYGLPLYGMTLGQWMIAFIVFDLIVGVVIFRARAEQRSAISQEFPLHRYYHHTIEVR